jgi:hypothetical protein
MIVLNISAWSVNGCNMSGWSANANSYSAKEWSMSASGYNTNGWSASTIVSNVSENVRLKSIDAWKTAVNMVAHPRRSSSRFVR